MRDHLSIYLLWTATIVLIAKSVGSIGTGSFMLIVSIATIVSVVPLLGISSGNASIVRINPANKFMIIGNNLLVAFVWGGLISAGAHLLLTNRLNQNLSEIGTNLWGMAFIAVIPLMIFDLNECIVNSFGHKLYSYLTYLLKSLGIVILVLFFISRNELSAETAIGSWVLVLSAMGFIFLIITWSIVGHEMTINIPMMLKSVISGFKPYVVRLFITLTIHLDLIFIAYFLTIQDVGKYSVAIVLGGVTHRLAWALSGMIFWTRKIPTSPNTPSALFLRLTLNFAILSGIVIVFGSWFLIHNVIGYEFLNSYVVLLILIPGFVFLSQSRLVMRYHLLKSEFFYLISIAISAFLLFFGLNLILIPTFGIKGAAVAFSLSQGFSWIVLLYLYTRKINMKFSEMLLIRKGDLYAAR